ncbi:MAG: pyridoxamine kinase [Bacilli bacterium]|nr:pyridoxamine kinase [Bacilli bacterium]
MRILSIQDISCYGQCSLTVALPILSSLGVETAILPTAILSTHTAGFKGYTFLDLQHELPKIEAHWNQEGIRFDAVYTGYLGNTDDVQVALSIAKGKLNRGPFIVDPAFGDHGNLYPGFDKAYVESMVNLVREADVLLPNLTEACALLGIPYVERPSKEEIQEIFAKLHLLGVKTIVLKGIGNDETSTGIAVSHNGEIQYYSHPKLPRDFHGTGDVFASVFVGGYLQGLSPIVSGTLAADFVCDAIKNTIDDPAHGYGVKFEPLLTALGEKLISLK